jgi:hypothetical protein
MLDHLDQKHNKQYDECDEMTITQFMTHKIQSCGVYRKNGRIKGEGRDGRGSKQ